MSEHFIPKGYQVLAADQMVEDMHRALFLNPGRGKTAVSYMAFLRLRQMFEANRMLVVAPRAVAVTTWPNEAAKWDMFEGLRIQVIGGPKKLEHLQADADVFVITPDMVHWLSEQKWEWPEMLVVDESTKFKRIGRRRSRAIQRILRHFERRYIMTGTPSPNGLIDLFGQIYIVDGGAALGRRLGEDFQAVHFVPVRDESGFYRWFPRENAMEEISKKIAPFTTCMTEDDMPDMPDLVTHTIPVELPGRARQLYNEFRRELIIEIDQGEVTAANAGARSGKCRQIAAGRIYLDDIADQEMSPDGYVGKGKQRRGYATIHESKVEALQRLVEELGGKPVLIGYEFKHDLDAIRQAVGDLPVIGAGVSSQRIKQLVAEWNTGTIPCLAAHPGTAGHGLNLQDGGHVVIWYTPIWDLELYQQLIRRIYRQGQKHRVLVYHLAARGTNDERVIQALQQKDADQSSLLSALKENPC